LYLPNFKDEKKITSDVSGMNSLGYRRLAISQLKLMRGGLYVSSAQRKEKLRYITKS